MSSVLSQGAEQVTGTALIGIALIVAGGWLLAGPVGLVAALVLGAVAVWVDALLGFAIGQLFLAATVSEVTFGVGLVELGLVGLVFSRDAVSDINGQALGWFAVLGGVFTGTTHLLLRFLDSLLWSGLGVLALCVIVLYGIHRYEVYSLLVRDIQLLHPSSEIKRALRFESASSESKTSQTENTREART